MNQNEEDLRPRPKRKKPRTFDRAADLDCEARVSGRTLGQRAAKVRVNNEGVHVRLGPPADPFASTGHSHIAGQSTLTFSKRPDVPAFQSRETGSKQGDISYSSDFSGHSASSAFWRKAANTSHAASSGQPQTSGFVGN